MKVVVPEHLNELLDRIIDEYTELSKVTASASNDTPVNICNVIYKENFFINWASYAKHFKEMINDPCSELFVGNSEIEVKKIIIKNIYDFIYSLPEDIGKKFINSITVEPELEERLSREYIVTAINEDAFFLRHFIHLRTILTWGKIDSEVQKIVFKFVSTEEDFEKLFANEHMVELTPQSSNWTYSAIRVAFIQKDEEELYVEKGIWEDYQRFHEKYSDSSSYAANDSFNYDDYLQIFNHWNDIQKTGIYYVYIPDSKCKKQKERKKRFMQK